MIHCPIPKLSYDRILLGHGSGGRLTAELVDRLFLPAFGGETLSRLEDQATLDIRGGSRLAFTTDAFVVRPLFFPGGDIGKLAIHGTVNDLAVGGAIPRFISASFVLEEGLPLEDLARIAASMREACAEANVELVTADTKVVEKGRGDQVFITTSGIGVVPDGRSMSIAGARPGDRILVSGTLGDHGVAILSVREGLEFETELSSDSAPLADLTEAMLEVAPRIRCMRDPTRGGLASSLNELARASNAGVRIEASALPLRPEVQAACEMLGLDPLHVASEGRLVAVVPEADAAVLLEAMRAHPKGKDAAVIGEVTREHPGTVVLRSIIGSNRVLSPLVGEQLPRIC